MQTEKIQKYRGANLGRIAISSVNLSIVYYFKVNDSLMGILGLLHFLFSILWYTIIEFEILIERNYAIASFIPATLDVTAVTSYCALTGNIHSFLVSAYVGLTAIPSVGEKRLYGLYTFSCLVLDIDLQQRQINYASAGHHSFNTTKNNQMIFA